MLDVTDPTSAQRWIDVFNVSGEVIPPFAALRMVGVNPELAVMVAKPDTNNSVFVLINGPASVPVNGYGLATNDFPAVAGILTSAAIGQTLGTVAGFWGLVNTGKGFKSIALGTAGKRVPIIRDFCVQ